MKPPVILIHWIDSGCDMRVHNSQIKDGVTAQTDSLISIHRIMIVVTQCMGSSPIWRLEYHLQVNLV